MPLAALTKTRHGKARVRVAKVIREGQERIAEYTVQVELVGGTEESFLQGDNRNVVATDTCKNHVYLHAKEDSFESPESFAVSLSKRLLRIYGHVKQVLIEVAETPWTRVSIDNEPHHHGFTSGSDVHGCRVIVGRESTKVISKLSNGWAGFVMDRYTTLPETNERILATEVNAEWSSREGVDHQRVYNDVKEALVRTFFGPAKSGIFSKGVQETLYMMGDAVIRNVHEVERITISLPNLHFLPCTIPVYAKNGIKFDDDVFVPCDEPHGIITAIIERPRARL